MFEIEPDIQELIERVTRQYRVAQESAASELRETREKLLAEHREAQVKGEWTTAKDIRVALQRAEERAECAARRAREDHEGLLGVLQERAQRRQAELNEDPEELVSSDMMCLFDDSVVTLEQDFLSENSISDINAYNNCNESRAANESSEKNDVNENEVCEESCVYDLAGDFDAECHMESCTIELNDEVESESVKCVLIQIMHVRIASEIESDLMLNVKEDSNCWGVKKNVDLLCSEQINDLSIEPVLTEPGMNEDRESIQCETLLNTSDYNRPSCDAKPEVDIFCGEGDDLLVSPVLNELGMNDDCEEDFMQELDSASLPRDTVNSLTVNTLDVIQLVELNASENLVCDKNSDSDFESLTVKQYTFEFTVYKCEKWWEIVDNLIGLGTLGQPSIPGANDCVLDCGHVLCGLVPVCVRVSESVWVSGMLLSLYAVRKVFQVY